MKKWQIAVRIAACLGCAVLLLYGLTVVLQDKRVTLDYDTTRHIFHHFYGEKANYEGYMTKFMSHNPFYYSITYEARNYLLQLLRERCGLTDEFFTDSFLIEEKNTVQNISINYKINCSTIREIEQILMNIDRNITLKILCSQMVDELNQMCLLSYF